MAILRQFIQDAYTSTRNDQNPNLNINNQIIKIHYNNHVNITPIKYAIGHLGDMGQSIMYCYLK